MHILTNGGLDILTSLELSKYSVGFVLKQEISALKKKLEKGISLKESFNSSSFFNIEYKNYITIGEETGDLNFIFSHIKNIYLIRIKEKIKRFLKILEPVSIIFIALIIGVIIFSIMLPIFKLGENIDI
jgi:type IV pilus assembly protein PilC